jgi:hypothetical protein
MPPVYFAISHSRSVQESFERSLERTRRDGRYPVALRAAHFLWDELAYDPFGFGESRYHLKAADLHIRIGFAPPWGVEYGIHLPSRTVFLRRFVLLRF